MSEKLIIVGGLPEPIGGVTTFLRRLLFSQSDDIDCFVDIYPGTKKQLPKTIADKVIYLQGKLKFLREKLKDMMHTHDFLHVFDSQSEDLFNQCLAQSDCLLRLNSVDSFGIAVADAITLDVPVVASDVCERFPGAVIVSDFDYDTIDLAIEQALATKQSKKLAVSKRFYFDLEPLISSDAKN